MHHPRKVVTPLGFVLLLAALSAAPAQTMCPPESESGRFIIQALGDRCLDVVSDRRDEPSVVIKPCNCGPTQTFLIREIDESHDFHLYVPALGKCVGLAGPVAPGQRLELQPCGMFGANVRRFAFDGDALLVGTQSPGERVARDFVLEPLEANTQANTPVVVGTRDASDAEYWRMIATDGSNARPTTAFVSVDSAADLRTKIQEGDWGTVIELEPPGPATAIELSELSEMEPRVLFSLKEGMTLRGGRKFIEHGAGLRMLSNPAFAEKFILALRDQARVTGLHLQGNPDVPDAWGLAIVNDATPPNRMRAAFVDHVDLSRFSIAIQVRGASPNSDWACSSIDPATGVVSPADCVEEDDYYACPAAGEFTQREDSFAKVLGNFIHHNRDYGVAVAVGGDVLASGNLLFLNAHDVTSTFNGFNRYIVRDSLFTSQRNHASSTILDVHGSCSRCGSHWVGGRAGGAFEATFNSFLTAREPLVEIRGTPCEHFSFDNNLAVKPHAGALWISTPPWTEAEYEDERQCACRETVLPPWHYHYHYTGNRESPGKECPFVPPVVEMPICAMSNGEPFVPGDAAAILHDSNNQFNVPNPTASSGDFGVGDFDGDGVDDLFLGTGVSWWFSAGGKTEWRFLNRMPQRASELRFGDFDGDGRTDVIALRGLNGAEVHVSWAGGSPWFWLNTTEELFTIADLAVGDFDGDRHADLFVANGEKWTWSSAGTSPWAFFADSGHRTPALRFGDFDDDERTDVFGIVEDAWHIVRAPNQSWEFLGAALTGYDMTALVVADFDGDGYADVGRGESTLCSFSEYCPDCLQNPSFCGTYTNRLLVSWGGTSAFEQLLELSGLTAQGLTTQPMGRFDAVAGADVLLWRDGLWLSIASGGHDVHPWSWQSMR